MIARLPVSMNLTSCFHKKLWECLFDIGEKGRIWRKYHKGPWGQTDPFHGIHLPLPQGHTLSSTVQWSAFNVKSPTMKFTYDSRLNFLYFDGKWWMRIHIRFGSVHTWSGVKLFFSLRKWFWLLRTILFLAHSTECYYFRQQFCTKEMKLHRLWFANIVYLFQIFYTNGNYNVCIGGRDIWIILYQSVSTLEP